MKIHLLYFGVLKGLFGLEREILELRESARVEDALALLRERSAARHVPWQSLAAAVNREYAGSETELREGDELALLPPVSGGSNKPIDAEVVLSSPGIVCIA